jgi:hypothetical protein
VSLRIILCVLIACGLLIAAPVAAAGSSQTNARDNPQLLSGLKNHIAYYGGLQQAQMDGTIRYINILTNGTGIYDLQTYEEDYLISASSVPLMTTADDISAARDIMQEKTRKFSAMTQEKMMKYNGKPGDLGKYVNASVSLAEESIRQANGSSWLAKNTSRLVVFNTYSHQRKVTLQNLENNGIDVADAREVADAMDALRPTLKNAVLNNKSDAFREINRDITDKNLKFRTLVSGYLDQMQLQSAIAAAQA